tara:strand:- start:7446 stop:8576 length:1131 start_codon:yes stop_codon:yes gene_type:complete
MKKLLFIFVLSTSIASAQWVQKTSCNKNAAKISNEAIESMVNLEYLTARGMAMAALLIDSDCGCAQLTLAAISSSNKNWGSQKEKLKGIDYLNLSAEEKTWHGFLMSSSEDRPAAIKSGLTKHPNSPLINYLATSPTDMKTFSTFAGKFPEQAASSYNMMSYGYLRGDFGNVDQEMAMNYVKQSQNLHNGPNAYDSMAEHYASLGDYEKALELELKAVDFAAFGSPYWNYARVYYSKVNQTDLSKELMKSQIEVQDAIIDGDYEIYAKYEHPEIKHVTGDSNLSPFYDFNKSSFNVDQEITWNNFDMNDINVTYSPDMRTAVLTFYSSGSYVFNESKEEVAYSTRGSSVWVSTPAGWKIMHSSWAPNKDGIGIPQS